MRKLLRNHLGFIFSAFISFILFSTSGLSIAQTAQLDPFPPLTDWTAVHNTGLVLAGSTGMIIPCDIATKFSTSGQRRCAYKYDYSTGKNFSIYKEFVVKIYVADTKAVDKVTFYFGSGGQYFSRTLPVQLGLQTLTFKVADYAAEPGILWSSISTIMLSPWAPDTPAPLFNTNLEVKSISAIPRSSVAVLNDSSSNNTINTLNQGFIPHDGISIADIGYLSPSVTQILMLPTCNYSSLDSSGEIKAYIDSGGKIFCKSFTGWQDLLNQLNQMVLGLSPSIGEQASNAAYKANSRVGQANENFADCVNYIQNKKAALPYTTPSQTLSQIDSDLQNAQSLIATFTQRKAAGLYADAIDTTTAMNAKLRDAYELIQQPGTAAEFRGIWSHDALGPYPDQWSTSIGNIKNAGLNAIISGVSGAGSAAYDSPYIPYSIYYQPHGDQLAAVISAAHAAGIKVHAWDLVWNLYGADYPSTSSTPAIKYPTGGRYDAKGGNYGDWYKSLVDQHRLMGQVVKDSNTNVFSVVDMTHLNSDSGWLSPCNQANQDLKIAVLKDIATRYEVDGIHLDFNRANGDWTMFETACKDRFESEKGSVTKWPDDVVPTGIRGVEYNTWRTTIITKFTRDVHNMLVKVNETKQAKGQPNVILSAAVFNEYESAKKYNAQDWVGWIEQKIVTQVHPMNYTFNYPRLTDWLQRQTAEIDRNSNGLPFYPGLITVGDNGEKLRSDELIDQINATRGDNTNTVTYRRAAGGFTLFNYADGFVGENYLASLAKGITSNQTAAAADISVSAAVNSPQQIVAGTPFGYTLTINNSGPNTATSIETYITLPTGLIAQTVSTSSGSCGAPSGTFKCTLGASAASGSVTLSLVSSVAGTYQIDASARSASTDPNSANNVISKKVAVNKNVALNKTVATSSNETTSLSGSKAVDGVSSYTSRWSSSWRGTQSDSWKDNQNITVDLGNAFSISRVILNWEKAYGKEYMVKVSSDNINWTTVYSTITGHVGIDNIPLSNSVTARYIRMQGIKRGTVWGYSLFEFEVYGVPIL